MKIDDELGMHTDDGDIPSSSHNSGTADMLPGFNPGGLSSDGEPPSRSQSPSADELSHLHPSVPPQSQHPMPVPKLSLLPTMNLPLNDQSTKSFDYKEPRPLHEDFTPPLLTSFDNPIWEVVQDMREQRMSLCQSLRQYVFVHAAIIEGALMVVDEEKEIADGLIPRNPSPLNLYSKEAVVSRSPSTSSHRHAHMNEAASISSAASTGKRGASPTELLKEDKQGDAMLAKRPSIKRKHCSGRDHAAEDVRYHPVPVRVPSSALYAGGMSAPSSRAMPP
jgi:protein-tyrosine phosphatase